MAGHKLAVSKTLAGLDINW